MKTKIIDPSLYKTMGINLLKEFHDFCVKSNIPYTLGYGTLLGAIRHNGYIPWDDDIDLFLFAEDCELFYNKYKGSCIYNTCLKSNTYFLPFDKFSDNETIKFERCNIKDKYQIGFNIDIFPIYCFKNIKTAKKCFSKIQFLNKIFIIKMVHSNNFSFVKKIIIKILQFLIPFSLNTISKKIIKKIQKYSCSCHEQGSVATLISDVYSKKLVCFDSTLLKERTLHKFENDYFYVPKNYHLILEHIYGDYMTPPPIENQLTHHDFIVIKK